MRVLADTNVVARAAQPGHPKHAVALQALDRILARNDDLCIVPQVIYEFWVIATKPESANGLGMSVDDAKIEIAKTQRIFSLLRDERAILSEWERLVVEHGVRGKSAHDARLVAAMKRHGLNFILTFNGADFARYPGIIVMTPDEVAQAE